jgi:hypothetical protein
MDEETMKLLRGPPALLPFLIGPFLPTVAFFIAQNTHSYIAGQDEDLDGAVTQAALALATTTAWTIPGFLALPVFLYLRRDRLHVEILWLASLVGTGIMAAMVLGTHPGMYDLLYTRGRMHSTTGMGILFVSFSCIIGAVVTALLASRGQKIWVRRGQRQRSNAVF